MGVCRERLTRVLLDGEPGVRVVQGVAGCGKTTVLAQAAAAGGGRAAWVSADGTDRSGGRFLRALARAAGAPQVEAHDPAQADDPAEALFGVLDALDGAGEPTLLVVDDAHELAGAPAAEALTLLCRYRPTNVTLVLGARHLRGLDHWRWRASGDVRELDSDSLRFRLWEVDTLFREHYRVPLSAAELQAVSRLTDGWAVALHLFYVATRRLPPGERQRLVAGPRLTVRSIRDYLANQVLATVDTEHRALLRRMAVLDRIRADRCERLLGREGCAGPLHHLAEVGLLLPDVDGATYRLHELLRAQLLGELEEEVGAGGVAGLHRLAADVLEAEGDVAEAMRACGRGGDWAGVRRLLARDDGLLALSGAWAEDVPSHLRDTDPWVLRAIGRRQLREGDLSAGRASLRASVERFREEGGDARTQRELRLLEGWLAPDPGQRRTWTECLRAALAGEPVESWPDEPAGWLAAGVAALAVGKLPRAADLLGRASGTLSGDLGVVAELALCLATALAEPDATLAAECAVARARAGGGPALAAVAESLAAYAAGEVVVPDAHATAARERNDGLGEALHWLVGGLALLRAGDHDAAAAALASADGRFGAVGLRVPAGLAHAAALLARARRDDVSGDEVAAEVTATRPIGPLPHALALLAQAEVTGDPSSEQQARILAAQHGFTGLLTGLDAAAAPGTAATATVVPGTAATLVPGTTVAPMPGSGRSPVALTDPASPAPTLEARCMGQLQVAVDGVERDIDQLRPRHQELLGILVAHPNTWLHRERLFVWLWPDASMDKATRNLQVAISAVRRLLEPDAAPGQPRMLVRSGERYRLVVDPEGSDVERLQAALARARAAARAGDAELAGNELDAAFGEWIGEPAAPSGPAEWAVELRRQLAHEVSTVAVQVVDVLRAAGARDRAATLAARAVDVNPLDDPLWRLAVDSAAESGAAVLASDLEHRYRQLASSGWAPAI